MRAVLIVAAAVTVLASSGASAQESFFNKRYCVVPGGANSGSILDCAYSTLEQCRASAGNTTRYCSENPNWRVEPSAERTRSRKTRG
jgi:hypothetical protein